MGEAFAKRATVLRAAAGLLLDGISGVSAVDTCDVACVMDMSLLPVQIRSSCPSLITDTGIDPSVTQVNREIDDDEDDGVDQHEVLNYHPVTSDQRLYQKIPQPWNAERRLGGHRSPQ